MEILLKELEGYKIEDASKYKCQVMEADVSPSSSVKSGKNTRESIKAVEAKSEDNDFTVTIEAMHCFPYATGNYTRYMPDACKNSLAEWTAPYQRPTIMYHNDYDGIVNGRIVNAYMSNSSTSNTNCLMLEATAPGYQTRHDIKDGILKTVSIGVNATDVRCSICHAQIAGSADEMCEHIRGEQYDGQTCYWDIYEFSPKELSYVIVPSDKYAQIVSVNEKDHDNYYFGTKDNSMNLCTNQDNNSVDLNVYQDNKINLTEGKNQDIHDLNIDESSDSVINTKEFKEDNMDEKKLQDALKLNESLKNSVTALQNDKISLSEQLDEITKEKVSLQESVKELKEQISAKDLVINQEKELREAQEKENSDLKAEVKLSLIESLNNLREKANKPKIENLQERSIDSLRDSISDLKSELEMEGLKESKKEIQNPALQEPEVSFNNKQTDIKESENKDEQSNQTIVLY